MRKRVAPDDVLMKIPSLTAVKAFLAAAKYQSITDAAQALCVTQAAISRKVRELEEKLGVELFTRNGRRIELTEAGSRYYDATYLSFVNIAEASQQFEENDLPRDNLTVCTSRAFSSLWLAHALPDFYREHPGIGIDIIATEHILSLEGEAVPDIYVTKHKAIKEGYRSIPLFYDIIYPVCTESFYRAHQQDNWSRPDCFATLMDLSAYGRSQLAEHFDWQTWLTLSGASVSKEEFSLCKINDYTSLLNLVKNNQGVALGWDHLVRQSLLSGELVKPLGSEHDLPFKTRMHYLAFREELGENDVFSAFYAWFVKEIKKLPSSVVT